MRRSLKWAVVKSTCPAWQAAPAASQASPAASAKRGSNRRAIKEERLFIASMGAASCEVVVVKHARRYGDCPNSLPTKPCTTVRLNASQTQAKPFDQATVPVTVQCDEAHRRRHAWKQRLPRNPLVAATMDPVDHRRSAAIRIARAVAATIRIRIPAAMIDGVIEFVVGLIRVAGGLHGVLPFDEE